MFDGTLQSLLLRMFQEQDMKFIKAIQGGKIVLGGSSSGEYGGPDNPAGFVGKLSQRNICYDTDEFASSGSTSGGSEPCLVNNLNRIRGGYAMADNFLENRHVQWGTSGGSISARSIPFVSSSGSISAGNVRDAIEEAYQHGGGGGGHAFDGNTWIVGDGPDADFDSLSVAHADSGVSDGDVLLVYPGTYDGFTCTKALSIIGLGVAADPTVSFGLVTISGLTTQLNIQAETAWKNIVFSEDDVAVNTYYKVTFEKCYIEYSIASGAYDVDLEIKDSTLYRVDCSAATGGEILIHYCHGKLGSGAFEVAHGAADLYLGDAEVNESLLSGTGERYTIPDVHVEKTADTSSPVEVMNWRADSTGTPAAGFGVRHKFSLESDSGEGQDAAAMDVVWEDVGAGTEESAIAFLTRTAGGELHERFRIGSVLGKMFFSENDGLLLLDMQRIIKESGTNYIIGSRKQRAEVSGALHVEQGRWTGRQGLVIEQSTTNYIPDPVCEWGTFGGSIGWRLWANGSWQNSWCSQVSDPHPWPTQHCYKVTVGASGWIACVSYGNNLTASSGDNIVMSVWLNLTATSGVVGNARLYGGSNDLTQPLSLVRSAGPWGLYEAKFTGVPAGSYRPYAFYVVGCTAGDVVWWGGAQAEKGTVRTSLCWGGAGDGYTWAGTPHQSSSTRTATGVTVPAQGNLNVLSSQAGTIAIRFRLPYASGEAWTQWGRLFEYGNYTLPVTQDMFACHFDEDGDTIKVEIRRASDSSIKNTGWRTVSYEEGEEILVVVAYDSTSLELYWNDTEIGSITSPNLFSTYNFNEFHIGAQGASGYSMSNMICSEFATFNRKLTAAEVAQLYNFQRPLVDMGAIEKPGLPVAMSWPIYSSVDAAGFDDSGSFVEAGSTVMTGMFRFTVAGAWFDGCLVQFECHGYAVGATGRARLYNVTDSVAVPGSELSWTAGTNSVKRSGPLALPLGPKQYAVQVKIDTAGGGNNMSSHMARLVISPGLDAIS